MYVCLVAFKSVECAPILHLKPVILVMCLKHNFALSWVYMGTSQRQLPLWCNLKLTVLEWISVVISGSHGLTDCLEIYRLSGWLVSNMLYWYIRLLVMLAWVVILLNKLEDGEEEESISFYGCVYWWWSFWKNGFWGILIF